MASFTEILKMFSVTETFNWLGDKKIFNIDDTVVVIPLVQVSLTWDSRNKN